MSITRIFASTLSEITINPNNNVASGNGSANGSGTIKSGGINPSNNMWGFLHAFNLFVGFFLELWQNYQGVQTNKQKNLQEFQHKPHESLCIDV